MVINILEFEKIEDIEDKDSFLNMGKILGSVNLLKCLRAAIYKNDICCITDNEVLHRNFEPYFKDLFGIHAPAISTINSRESYGSFSGKDVFIFNPDQDQVIRQPFKKNMKPEKFKLEYSMLKNVNMENRDNEMVMEALKSNVKNVFKVVKEVINGISNRKILNQREMKRLIEEEAKNGNLALNEKDVKKILKRQFNYETIFINPNSLRSGHSNW